MVRCLGTVSVKVDFLIFFFPLLKLGKFPVMVHCVAPQMLVLAEGRGHCRDGNGRAEALGQVTASFGCAACQTGSSETLPSAKKII